MVWNSSLDTSSRVFSASMADRAFILPEMSIRTQSTCVMGMGASASANAVLEEVRLK